MNRIFFIFNIIVSLIAIPVISGCGTAGGKPEPIPVDLTISASKNLNPDIDNRASPIVIRIYQLTQTDTFNNNDFFALYENDQNILAKDLIFREELEIKPGQSFVKPLKINSDSKYITVLAAFRDLDNAQWKSILKIDPLAPPPLKINLEKFNVSIKTNINK